MKIPQLIELPNLKPIDRLIAELILDTPAPGKHRARHALHHIKRAWEIKSIDPEMAVFRAITAEEEAASAIFCSLQRHKYPGAEKLNHRNHVHKAAVRVMFDAIKKGLAVSEIEKMEPGIEIDTNISPRRFQIYVKGKAPDGTPFAVKPVPPLGFSMKMNGLPFNFAEQLENIATKRGTKSVEEMMRDEANKRNKMLYASASGIPLLKDPPIDFILNARQANVLGYLRTYLLIDPYPEHQMFVCQCLEIFLRAVRLVRDAKTMTFSEGEGI